MFKFHIRGKPWLVSVDDYLLFDEATDPKEPLFAQLWSSWAVAQEATTPRRQILWPPLLEKAYAKVKGVYGRPPSPTTA